MNFKYDTERNLGTAVTEILALVVLIALGCILLFGLLGRQGKEINSHAAIALAGFGQPGFTTDIKLTGADFGVLDQSPEPNSSASDGSGSLGPSTQPPKGTTDDLLDEFAKAMLDASLERGKMTAEQIAALAERTLQDMHVSQDQFVQMLERAKQAYTVNGEPGSTLAMESLQQARANVQRDAAALEAAWQNVQVGKGLKYVAVGGQVLSVLNDSATILSEGYKSMTDPAHSHEHDGKLVGTAVGAVAGGAIISATAVSAPLLIVGIAGAVLVGWGSKKFFSWWGRSVDSANANRIKAP